MTSLVSHQAEPMTLAPSQRIGPSNDLALGDLSARISTLMIRYCDAIEACGSVPTFSPLPILNLCFQYILWILCLAFSIVTLLIDLPLLLVRAGFGRPRFLLGRGLYWVIARPFRSAWKGEVSIFAVCRLRYLTRLLLFYRAQAKINALHRVYNRRNLNLFLSEPAETAVLDEVEKFQKSFNLFKQITTDSYKLGALAVGGDQRWSPAACT